MNINKKIRGIIAAAAVGVTAPAVADNNFTWNGEVNGSDASPNPATVVIGQTVEVDGLTADTCAACVPNNNGEFNGNVNGNAGLGWSQVLKLKMQAQKLTQ